MPPSPGVAARSYADALARSQAYAQAYSTARYAANAALRFGVDPYVNLRERYVHGWIDLGQFEAGVEVLLRRAA